MKNFAKILLILFWIVNFNTVYVEEDPYIWKSNVEKTILMWKYLSSHKENIINFSIKYEIENDYEIKIYIEKINYLIDSLEKVQENWLDKEKEDLLISTILNEIKKINEQLKILLKNKKLWFEKNLKLKKEMYSNIAYKLSFKIEEIYKLIYDKELLEKKILTENELKLKNAMKEINNLSKKLKYFSYIEFDSPSNVQKEFVNILKEIKNQISIIKKNM